MADALTRMSMMTLAKTTMSESVAPNRNKINKVSFIYDTQYLHPTKYCDNSITHRPSQIPSMVYFHNPHVRGFSSPTFAMRATNLQFHFRLNFQFVRRRRHHSHMPQILKKKKADRTSTEYTIYWRHYSQTD